VEAIEKSRSKRIACAIRFNNQSTGDRGNEWRLPIRADGQCAQGKADHDEAQWPSSQNLSGSQFCPSQTGPIDDVDLSADKSADFPINDNQQTEFSKAWRRQFPKQRSPQCAKFQIRLQPIFTSRPLSVSGHNAPPRQYGGNIYPAAAPTVNRLFQKMPN
jgi:hypothetical protein